MANTTAPLSGSTARAVWLTGALLALTAGVVGVRLTPDLAVRPHVALFLVNVAYWLLWTLLATPVLYLGGRYPLVGGRRARALAVHVVASLAFAATHLALVAFTQVLIRTLVMGASVGWPPLPFPGRMWVEWEVTTYWALVGLAHALSFSREAQEQAVAAASLEAQLARAQLQVLQRQLHPHFLFNTLQSISALVHRDPSSADRMIEHLADLLRLTLRGGDATEVSLGSELQHTRHYLAIEEVNMGDRLRVVLDVAPNILGVAVPSLLLQPIVENAIRHGLAPRASGGTVTIRGRRDGATIELQVMDDGVGLRNAEGAGGIGIMNTRQRLAQLYGARQSLEISALADGGVTVTIRLPYRLAAGPRAEEMSA